MPLLIALAAGTATAAATPSATPAGDPAVITDWNAIAVATLSADTTKQPVEDILYSAFVQAAVYNAVVGIEGRYAPYRFHAHAPRGASAQAAAVAAAHEILVTTSRPRRPPWTPTTLRRWPSFPTARRRPAASRSASAPPTA